MTIWQWPWATNGIPKMTKETSRICGVDLGSCVQESILQTSENTDGNVKLGKICLRLFPWETDSELEIFMLEMYLLEGDLGIDTCLGVKEVRMSKRRS